MKYFPVMRRIWLMVCLLLAGLSARAQNLDSLVRRAMASPHRGPHDTILVAGIVIGHDTLPYIGLPEVVITAEMPKALRKRLEEWTRLRNAVYVTYPYARAASRILREAEAQLAAMPDKKSRKAYIKKKEAELRATFGPQIENLSVYQGRILIKLIYRETGTSCYDIIKEMKGGFSARFWQTIAFFFGSNLKSTYDTQEDRDIEAIVQEIQHNPYYRYY
ncbi:DUF4294 domain-containing protein [Thermoflavifilum thermophilum]|nr:DUF4294 domain-containing protein [Thermoflavifilum thermophilum]